jgi:uncharacterized protein YndB with AHSA1/START domain
MRTWTAHTTTGARPEAVLDTLTDPDACRRWAPVAFDLEDGVDRLQAGTRTRVSGRLAGRRVGFDVEVHEATDNELRLSACGPVRMDVAYQLAARPDGSRVSASVSVHPGRGLLGVLMTEAANGLLKAGALSQAVNRLAREAALA